ncbi:MAG TPA: GTP-binding protein, partial [Thermomicrobiales bacterium]|nr:GTP-binding protein [Thermomicrobiales bacterium]
MPIVNLGILAHVDAGKTSLTERILFETGVIRSVGSVDGGDTQTDTLELERERGITIQSALVSFHLGNRKINLIDTPGHADFVAEVERALLALDAVVIVVSAVEGIQPQTRRLVRIVRSRGLPMLIFINKIDRAGARDRELLAEFRARLGLRVFAMAESAGSGSTAATVSARDLKDPIVQHELVDVLSESSDELVAAFLDRGTDPSRRMIRRVMHEQIRTGELVPVYCGSAILGVGTDLLLHGVERLLPPAPECSEAPLEGVIFKIQRTPAHEKLVYLRIRGGTIGRRDRVNFGRTTADGDSIHYEARVTAVDWFDRGNAMTVGRVEAGEIVRIHG